jgi:hypothetical protein
MALTLVTSDWRIGKLGFRRKSNGGLISTISPNGLGEGLTRVDKDERNITLLAADLAAGLLTHNSKTGAATLTVDTGANLDAAFPDWEIGEARKVHYVNRGDQTVTLTTAASGTTLVSAATIATLQGRQIWFLKQAATADYLVWAE